MKIFDPKNDNYDPLDKYKLSPWWKQQDEKKAQEKASSKPEPVKETFPGRQLEKPTTSETPADKPFAINQKKFKVVWYWKYKPDNTPYTVPEIQKRMNRKYSDSYDYTQGKENKNITNHQLALTKLVKSIQRNDGRYYKAILIMNDWEKQEELTIGVFYNGNMDLADFIEPVFTLPNLKGHVYVDFLPRDPLRIDPMREQNLTVTKNRKP